MKTTIVVSIAVLMLSSAFSAINVVDASWWDWAYFVLEINRAINRALPGGVPVTQYFQPSQGDYEGHVIGYYPNNDFLFLWSNTGSDAKVKCGTFGHYYTSSGQLTSTYQYVYHESSFNTPSWCWMYWGMIQLPWGEWYYFRTPVENMYYHWYGDGYDWGWQERSGYAKTATNGNGQYMPGMQIHWIETDTAAWWVHESLENVVYVEYHMLMATNANHFP